MASGSALSQWLRRLETGHDKKIDLGLERVGQVFRRLRLAPLAPVVISVAGTNGKGSTVAMLDSICQAAGYRTGRFTSPHLLQYNERFLVDGQQARDDAIVAAFEAIEKARGDISLSYFEFSTLAALWLFKRAPVDVAILEVGLGGRLDSVNVVDADCAVITTVDIDHVHWLGDNREAIGREKAGIFRAGRPAVCGDADCPLSVRRSACQGGARLYCRDKDFTVRRHASGFDWLGWQRDVLHLPEPALAGDWQIQNAATAIAALESLAPKLTINPEHYAQGLQSVRLAGRLQVIQSSPQILVDVAHNAQSAAALAQWLHQHPVAGKTRAVFGVLNDKQPADWLPRFQTLVDEWFCTQPANERALSAADCAALVTQSTESENIHAIQDPVEAYQHAVNSLQEKDRLLVFGSFFVLDPILHHLVEKTAERD